MTPLEPPLAEAARVLRICNACRYCEGYCATFAAMTRRLEFTAADLHYLANLCHHCGACLHACQYAPPHEFSVNVPRALASVRLQTYQQYAWPPTFARLYERQGMFVAVVLATSVAAFLAFVIALHGGLWHRPLAGDFYAVLPHGWMVGLFGPVFLYALLALGIGVWRFWHGAAPGVRRPDFAAALAAARDVATLRNLHGGHGEGCPNEDDRPTQARRLFHHLTFYGFLLCFAATTVATVYHYAFHWPAPYPLLSAPVLLGTAGGIGLLIGPAGLLWLHLRRDPLHGVPAQAPLDRAFLVLLLATSASGLALLAGRDTRAMAMLLALHLGCVLALFLTLPYGKFAHAVYRGAALLKWAIERRRPSALRLVND